MTCQHFKQLMSGQFFQTVAAKERTGNLINRFQIKIPCFPSSHRPAVDVRFKRKLERASTTSIVPSSSVLIKQFDAGENVTEIGRPLNWRHPSSSKYHSSSAAIFVLRHGFGNDWDARPATSYRAFPRSVWREEFRFFEPPRSKGHPRYWFEKSAFDYQGETTFGSSYREVPKTEGSRNQDSTI